MSCIIRPNVASNTPRWRPAPGPQTEFFGQSAEDDQDYQEGASRFARQQELVNGRQWLEGNESDRVEVEHLERQLATFSPAFWYWVRWWVVTLLVIAFVLFYQLTHRGNTMSKPDNETPPPAAQPQGEPSGSTLRAAINRFATAVLTMRTEPTTGMFFFDAQELTVNEKLETMKIQALIDSLCAAGLLDRKSFENRLEALLTDAAQKYQDSAKRIALGTVFDRKLVNGSGH